MLRIGGLLTATLLSGSVLSAAQPEPLKNTPTLIAPPATSPAPPSMLPPAGPVVPATPAAPAPEVAAPPAHPPTEMIEFGPPRQYTGLVPRLVETMNRPSARPEVDKNKLKFLSFFTYRPKEMTSMHDLCMPYNPRPPLYMYYFYPHPIEGLPHPYPYGKSKGWCSTCAAAPPPPPKMLFAPGAPPAYADPGASSPGEPTGPGGTSSPGGPIPAGPPGGAGTPAQLP